MEATQAQEKQWQELKGKNWAPKTEVHRLATVFSHALVGASVVAFAPRGVSKRSLGLVAAALACVPDLDVVGFQHGIAYASEWGHRGVTHSLSFALAAALIASFAIHRPRRSDQRTWIITLVLLFLATASHGVLDAFTDAGLGVGFFLPFDDTRYFFTHRPLATSPIG